MRNSVLLAPLVLVICIIAGLEPCYGDSVPFWGAKASVSIDTPIWQLKKGQFLWLGSSVPAGPVVMVVSLNEQKAFVYRNGVLIGATTVSTGRPGHLTPTGVFTVLQKQKEHRSTIYDGAPMPYMQRLTWGGIALHAGGLPGYPESHGCVHLPTAFAELLFATSPMGMTVVIGDEATEPKRVAHPGFLAPVNFHGGQPIERLPLPETAQEWWQPNRSASGPVSIVLSQGSHRIVVYRNGIEIGRARLDVVDGEQLASHTLVLMKGASKVQNQYVPDPSKYRWLQLGVPGHEAEAGMELTAAQFAKIRLPETFVIQVNSILTPGATVLVTPEPLSPDTSGATREVLDSNPPTARIRQSPDVPKTVQ